VTLPEPLTDLAIALGLGLLVGLQRESKQTRAAGLRTFAIVTLSGAICAGLVPRVGGWIVAAGFLGVVALAAMSYYATSIQDGSRGLTTEMALLAMFLIGAYVVAGDQRMAVVLGGSIAVLLQAKAPLRRVVARLGEDDMRAIMKFALLSLVILPVLPNRAFGPWGVLNLFEIWLLVVLIVGINLAGYIAYKFVGADTSALLGGILGGLISSTATTVSYSRRTKDQNNGAALAAVVVVIATAIVLIRVLIEVAVVAPRILRHAAIPLSIVLAAAIVVSIFIWWRLHGREVEMPAQGNPTMLRAALTFGALYAVVLLGVAWVRHAMGDSQLYLAAAVAGLTDVDAITLSTAKLAEANAIDATRAWRLILIAYISNLVFKAGIVAVLGSRQLLLRVVVVFAIIGAVAAGVIAFYPAGS
jgi:uncharacterized membrane protein (DUF4010 family)